MHRVNKWVAWLTKKNTAEIIQIAMVTIPVPSNKETLAPRAGNFLVPIWLLRLHGSIVRSRRVHIASLLSYSTPVHVCYVLLRQQLRVHTIYQRNQKTALYVHTTHRVIAPTNKSSVIKYWQLYKWQQMHFFFFSNNNKMLVYKTSAA